MLLVPFLNHRDAIAVVVPIVTWAGLGVLACPVYGFAMARRQLVRQLPIAVIIAVVIAVSLYVSAWLIFAPDDPGSDNGAGAGIVILGTPFAAGVAALVGMGVAVEWLVRRRQHRNAPVSS
jgi:amino acid transporter